MNDGAGDPALIMLQMEFELARSRLECEKKEALIKFLEQQLCDMKEKSANDESLIDMLAKKVQQQQIQLSEREAVIAGLKQAESATSGNVS